jgi:hypothetical protein
MWKSTRSWGELGGVTPSPLPSAMRQVGLKCASAHFSPRCIRRADCWSVSPWLTLATTRGATPAYARAPEDRPRWLLRSEAGARGRQRPGGKGDLRGAPEGVCSRGRPGPRPRPGARVAILRGSVAPGIQGALDARAVATRGVAPWRLEGGQRWDRGDWQLPSGQGRGAGNTPGLRSDPAEGLPPSILSGPARGASALCEQVCSHTLPGRRVGRAGVEDLQALAPDQGQQLSLDPADLPAEQDGIEGT